MKTLFTDDGIAVTRTSGEIVETFDSLETRNDIFENEDGDSFASFESDDDENETENSGGDIFDDETEENPISRFDYRDDPEFIGVHPNHRSFARSRKAYERANYGLHLLS